MQKLDFRTNYDHEKIKELIQELISNKIINENEAQYVNVEKILKFCNSNLYKDIQLSKQKYKEKPFFINISVDEIYNNGLKEEILVQGIIDLYYINEKDEIVLVDYKTDYVEKGNEQELVSKYERQLKIYKRALEQAIDKKVEKVYIYSIHLNKEIIVK